MAKVDSVTLLVQDKFYGLPNKVVFNYTAGAAPAVSPPFDIVEGARSYASHVVRAIQQSGQLLIKLEAKFEITVDLSDGTRHLISQLGSIPLWDERVVAVRLYGDLNAILQGLAAVLNQY